jgi:hypothetical protein
MALRTMRNWLALLAIVLALLGYSSIREHGETSAIGEQTEGSTEEASEGETANGGVPTEGDPVGSAAGTTSRTLAGTRVSSKVRGGSGGGRSLVGAGSLTDSAAEVVAFNRACGSPECDPSTSETKIHRIRADGSDDRRLVTGVAPGWSRDGKHIAFGTRHGHGNLQLMNADGSGWRDLGVGGAFPTWSPNGLRLAFNWNCESGPTCWEYPESPRGGCGPSECGIGVVAADGSGLQRLGNGLWPDWGRDGRIVFTDGTPTEPCQYGTAYWYEESVLTSHGSSFRLPSCALPMWIMSGDGTGRTALPIAKATAPKWSPDGKRIAYHVETEGVFISTADGTGTVKVAPAGFMDPSWSPDGKRLALTRRTSNDFIWSIFVRAADGSGEKQLTFGTRDTLPSFSPHH